MSRLARIVSSIACALLLGCHAAGVLKPRTVLNDREFVYTADFRPDDKRIALTRMGLKEFHLDLFDVSEKATRVSTQILGRNEYDVEGLAFSNDGRWLATCGRNGELRLFDGDNGRFLERLLLEVPLVSVAFDSTGQWVAVGASSGFLWVIDVETRRILSQVQAHQDEVRALGFTKDGRLFSGGWDKRVLEWALLSTGELQQKREFKFNSYINDFTLSANGEVLGLALSTPRALRNMSVYQAEKRGEIPETSSENAGVLFDLKEERELARWTNHRGVVSTAAVSPDGKMLLTGGWDNTLYLQQLNSPKVTTFKLAWLVRRVRFSSSGRQAVVAAWTPVKSWAHEMSAVIILLPKEE